MLHIIKAPLLHREVCSDFPQAKCPVEELVSLSSELTSMWGVFWGADMRGSCCGCPEFHIFNHAVNANIDLHSPIFWLSCRETFCKYSSLSAWSQISSFFASGSVVPLFWSILERSLSSVRASYITPRLNTKDTEVRTSLSPLYFALGLNPSH